MTMPNTVNDATITKMLSAMETTMGQVNSAISSVDAVSGSLPWQGDAATTYRGSLAAWITGVQKVKAGLLELQTAMSTHQNVSTNAETDATVTAKWFA